MLVLVMTNETPAPSLPLDGHVSVDNPNAVYTDELYTPVSWLVYRGAETVGGAYSTHAGAAQTIREFPAYFHGKCRIVPATVRYLGYGGKVEWSLLTEALYPA